MSSSKHELDAPPWQRVEGTLMATARAIRQAYDRRFACLGLNLSKASLLSYLNESGPLTQTQLAEGLGLGRAATGSVVDDLEKRGCVERQPDAEDRRVWRVAIQPAGKDLVHQIHEIDRVLRKQLRSGVPRSERQRLARLLLHLQSNLSDILSEVPESRAEWESS
ncbi:MAG: MarR family transcriptional regulator [Myxococcota bacterium]